MANRKKAAPKLGAKKTAAKKTAGTKLTRKTPSGKTASARTPPKAVLRGVALVDAALAHRKRKRQKFVGTPAVELAAMSLGDRPLSPSLERWLAADATMFRLGKPTTLVEMVRNDFGDQWASMYAELAPMLPAPIIVFEGWGSDSRRFVYLGKTDALGEYTVMTIDTDDTPFLCVNGPVDVWLSQQAGYLEEEKVYGHVPPAYKATQKAHAALNFHGHLTWEFMSFD